MAAVSASGPGALLSHLSSAARHDLRKDIAAIDVSVPKSNAPDVPGVRTHRVYPFHPDDIASVHDVPCTSVPRTLIDIAPMVGRRGVELAIAKAQFKRNYDRTALERAVERQSGRRGVAIVREILALDRIENTLTNRELEERFLALTRRAGIPLPLVNAWITAAGRSYKCDFVWHDARLIVETDGRETHTREQQFEEDRRRDSNLKLAGWEVVRFTWRQVIDEPAWVISVVRSFRDRRIAA